MTDKERILSVIVRKLMATAILNPGGRVHDKDSWGDYAHFAYYRKPQPGDMVVAKTALGVHEWSIAWFVKSLPDGAIVREIGSDRLCNYTNEDFTPIVGLHKSELLEGEEYRFYAKAQRAVAALDNYWHRFSDVEFPDAKTAVIWIREAFNGLGRHSTPYSVTMRRTPKTTIAVIKKALRAGGFGVRSFEP